MIHKWLWLHGFWWSNMENDCIKHCYLFTWLCTGQSICSRSVPPVRMLNGKEGRLDALPHCSKRCCHFSNRFRLFLITASFIPVHWRSGNSPQRTGHRERWDQTRKRWAQFSFNFMQMLFLQAKYQQFHKDRPNSLICAFARIELICLEQARIGPV